MHQTNVEIEPVIQISIGRFSGLGIKHGRLFDQWAHPVSLFALLAVGSDTFNHFIASVTAYGDGGDGGTVGRQFINNGRIHITKCTHGKGTRYGCGCHNQLMRCGMRQAFIDQRHSLLHPKTVLLIDNHQAQLGKIDMLLK